MKGRILHESRSRMRLHLLMPGMTGEDADILEIALLECPDIKEANVDERTGNAVIRFRKGRRESVLKALEAFSFKTSDIAPPVHSKRALRREYEDRIFFHIARRLITKIVLPAPVRSAITVAKALPYLQKALWSLLHGQLSVSVLDASSITVSLLRGEYDTAGSVMFLLGVGDIMEEWTHKKSLEDLASAMSLNVDKVWVRLEDGQEVLRGVDTVMPGDQIMVRMGNMIPLDGEVAQGEAMVNQSSMTGEPLAVPKSVGGLVYAGTVVEEGELVVTVRESSGQGRYDRIVAMIEESEKLKSQTEDRASHLADRLVPWTLGASGLTYLFTRNAAKAASILMVDFCCALKLSMPIAVLSAMREAGTCHISVKGGKFLENFAESTTLVFDKTGTLTNASPKVRSVVTFGNNDETEMLRLAACLEEHFPHSIANAVVWEAAGRGILHEERHSRVDYIVAHGIASSIEGKKVCVGSYHFIFEDEGCRLPEGEEERFEALPDECSHLYMAIDGFLCAVLLIEDPLRPEAAEVIKTLHGLGLERIVMMTGDSERTARAVAEATGVDEYHSEVLPEDKAGFIKAEHAKGRKVIMVGDGVNDSPALSEADVGVAINTGAAIAREIADITIMEEGLSSLVTLRLLSQNLMKRIHANYRTILSFNSFLILMGMLGLFPSATTALLHNASTIAISLKSMTPLLPEADERKSV